VRHCVPSRSCNLNILPASHTQMSLSLSLSRRADLAIAQPSDLRHDTRKTRQDARDCSIDSRSRCVPLSLMLALSLNLSRCD